MEKNTCSTAYQGEVKKVKQLLDQAKAGEIHRFIRAYHAPKGLGKSRLLRALWGEYERVLPGSLVQLSALRAETAAGVLREMLLQIIRDVVHRLPPHITDLPVDFESITDLTRLAEILVALAETAATYEKPTLLLLDDYDVLPGETQAWFQAQVLSPLGRTGKVVVVLTSQTEIMFKSSFELRMRYESYKLAGLSPESIACAFPGYEHMAHDIYSLTGGLPWLVEELVGSLKAQGIQDVGAFQRARDEVLETYYRTNVPQALSAHLPEDMRETFLALALLRRFDLTVLKEVLLAVFYEHYIGYSTAIDYLDLVGRMGSWLEWHTQGGGYTVNEAYRTVIRGYVQMERPDLYNQVHSVAFHLYHDRLQNEYQASYMMEMLYHRLALVLAERGLRWIMPQSKLSITVDEFLTDTNGNAVAQIQEKDVLPLYRTLTEDPDLMAHFSEDEIRAMLRTWLEKSERMPSLSLLLELPVSAN